MPLLYFKSAGFLACIHVGAYTCVLRTPNNATANRKNAHKNSQLCPPTPHTCRHIPIFVSPDATSTVSAMEGPEVDSVAVASTGSGQRRRRGVVGRALRQVQIVWGYTCGKCLWGIISEWRWRRPRNSNLAVKTNTFWNLNTHWDCGLCAELTDF